MNTDGRSLASLWLLTSNQAFNALIPDSTVLAIIFASWESISIMDFLPVFLQPFKSGSNLTPYKFANNTYFIIPKIIELLFPSGILISFRSFEMMPPFIPQGWFPVSTHLLKKKIQQYTSQKVHYQKDIVAYYFYISGNDWHQNWLWCHNSLFQFKVHTSCFSYIFTSLFLRGGIILFFIFALSVVELVILFALTTYKKMLRDIVWYK